MQTLSLFCNMFTFVMNLNLESNDLTDNMLDQVTNLSYCLNNVCLGK